MDSRGVFLYIFFSLARVFLSDCLFLFCLVLYVDPVELNGVELIGIGADLCFSHNSLRRIAEGAFVVCKMRNRGLYYNNYYCLFFFLEL